MIKDGNVWLRLHQIEVEVEEKGPAPIFCTITCHEKNNPNLMIPI
jgi:hypothetical protein